MITPEQAIDAINKRFGRHSGFRALHAKGLLCKGTFTATPGAAGLTRAAHMQGERVDVLVRFSNGSGDPGHPDYAPDVRGMAISFQLPDGSATDIVTQTVPNFPTNSPDVFIELVMANDESPVGRAVKLPLFFAKHPRALVGARANMLALRPPASYAAVTYYGVHAFKWIDAGAGERHVRYTLLPEGGEQRISTGAAKRGGRDYLQEEIARRLARGSVRMSLELQIAAAGDEVDDPSVAWPASRDRVIAGTIELTALETGREKDGDVLVFDPSRVTDGIEMSDDPILRFRPGAYSVSVDRRLAT